MTASECPNDCISDEPDTEALGLYHVAVEHEGQPGFICKVETSGGFIPSNEDVGFGLVSPLDAEWCGPSYLCEEHLAEDVLARWIDAGVCGCEIRRLNVIANGGHDEGQPFECKPTPKLMKLTLVRPDGERLVLYDAEAKGDA